jgi:hypothetical protein
MKRTERYYAIEWRDVDCWVWSVDPSSIDNDPERVEDEIQRRAIAYHEREHRLVTASCEWRVVKSAKSKREAWLRVAKKVNRRVKRL